VTVSSIFNSYTSSVINLSNLSCVYAKHPYRKPYRRTKTTTRHRKSQKRIRHLETNAAGKIRGLNTRMNITVRLPLRTSQRKTKKLEKAINRQATVAQHASQKIRSLPKTTWGGRNTKLNHVLRNQYPDNNGLHYTHYLYKIGTHVSDIYNNWMEDGFPGEAPDFSDMDYMSLCNCGSDELTFEQNNGQWGVKIPLLKNQENDWFKLRTGGYQEKHLEEHEIKDNSKIVKKNGRYELHQPVEIPEKNLDYTSQTRIGVDFNFDRLAVTAAVRDGELLDTEFYDQGNQLRHYREKMQEKRRSMQESGNGQLVEELMDKEDRYVRHVLHRISRDIVDQAQEHEKPVIVIEDTDIESMRSQVNEFKKNQFKTSINRWPVGRLKTFIEYKAEKEGIKVEKANPEYTSQECYCCGQKGERPYNGNQQRFYCDECDRNIDADLNAARNIANR